MNTFLTVHSELKKAPNNIKQYRFDHFEKLRQKTIEQVKAERQKIIEEQNNSNCSTPNRRHASIDLGLFIRDV